MVTISFTITNSGPSATASFTSNVRIAHSSTSVGITDPLLFSVTTIQVAAYGFTNITRTATIPAGRNLGANYIWTIVDVDGNAGQTNEANDISNVVFTVTASTNTPPDVFPRGLTVTPASGPTGTLVTISFTITNSGGTAASSFTSNVRIAHSSTNVTSSDPLLFSVTTMQVAAYGFTNISRTATIPAGRNTGANYIWTIVDVDGSAGQTNEANDKSNVVFTVTADGSSTPYIYMHPESCIVTSGSSAVFTVGVYGSQPLTYQWRKHGIDIPVNNNATLIINNAQTTDAAEYSVIISDTFGSATSMNAKLTVLGPTSDQAPESKVHISQQPGKTKLVVIVHGYIPPLTPDIMPEWVNHMRTSIVAQAPSEWQIEAYDWSKDAGRPIEHLRAPATEIGAGLGSDIINNTTFQHVHFIAHSAGSALIQAAADAINKRIGVHTTFLDAYKYITHHRRYGLNAHWSDSYYAHDRTINFTNGGLTNTHECEVSWLAPDSIRSIHTVYTRSGAPNEYFTIEYARSNHKWPHQFYLNTVNNVMMGDCSYGRYGYLLSREACERDNRDWDSHITHPPDRSSTLCARSEVVNQYFPDLQWGSPLDLSSIPASFSDWGVHLNQHDFYIGSTADTSLNRQPVQQGQNSSSSTTNNTLWIALGIAISNPVNCISFNTIFSDTAGIEILRVYWDSYHIGSIDSRIHGSGLHAHTFALPDTYTSGTFSLSFELYNLDENQGGALITNIALGFEENDVPIIVDTILNEQYGSPTVILYAPSNYVYELEISTNLIDWSSWALLMPTNEPVLIDTFRTNVSPMYYRARIY
ncbi:MAG TPA: CARDB domain-containing protein [Kiritimatiellia bacterium]|nr:CARDB domain-containing protein [Kiritimatiellia bacterium]